MNKEKEAVVAGTRTAEGQAPPAFARLFGRTCDTYGEGEQERCVIFRSPLSPDKRKIEASS